MVHASWTNSLLRGFSQLLQPILPGLSWPVPGYATCSISEFLPFEHDLTVVVALRKFEVEILVHCPQLLQLLLEPSQKRPLR